MSKFRVAFVRHGESEWTYENLFCGWVDVGLTDKGRGEARRAAEALRSENMRFDVSYTSLLNRAQESLHIILNETDQLEVPMKEAWQLNERHYGALTGHNKADMADKYGEQQVQIWRRSFDVLPPPMEQDHKCYGAIVGNPKFESIKDKIPKCESLKTIMTRVIPYWEDVIVPDIKSGKVVLVVCHGTSLRGIVKHLNQMSDKAIMKLNLPTGIPFIFEFDEHFEIVESMKFLSDEETVKKAMERVSSIGTSKESGNK